MRSGLTPSHKALDPHHQNNETHTSSQPGFPSRPPGPSSVLGHYMVFPHKIGLGKTRTGVSTLNIIDGGVSRKFHHFEFGVPGGIHWYGHNSSTIEVDLICESQRDNSPLESTTRWHCYFQNPLQFRSSKSGQIARKPDRLKLIEGHNELGWGNLNVVICIGNGLQITSLGDGRFFTPEQS